MMFDKYYEAQISARQLLSYLKAKLTRFQAELEKYGPEDRGVQRLMDEMLACKEMAEVVIGAPVNLQMDGKVTIGF